MVAFRETPFSKIWLQLGFQQRVGLDKIQAMIMVLMIDRWEGREREGYIATFLTFSNPLQPPPAGGVGWSELTSHACVQ